MEATEAIEAAEARGGGGVTVHVPMVVVRGAQEKVGSYR